MDFGALCVAFILGYYLPDLITALNRIADTLERIHWTAKGRGNGR